MKQQLMTPIEKESLGEFLSFYPADLTFNQVIARLLDEEHVHYSKRTVDVHEDVEDHLATDIVNSILAIRRILEFREANKRG